MSRKPKTQPPSLFQFEVKQGPHTSWRRAWAPTEQDARAILARDCSRWQTVGQPVVRAFTWSDGRLIDQRINQRPPTVQAHATCKMYHRTVRAGKASIPIVVYITRHRTEPEPIRYLASDREPRP